jgi:hypothetical protein
MADYLAGVVARATGAAETVRPKVPALFEPAGFGVADVTAIAPAPRGDGLARPDEPAEPVPLRERPNEREGAELAAAPKENAVDRTIEPPTEPVSQAEPAVPAQAKPRVERPPSPATAARPRRAPAPEASLAPATSKDRTRPPAPDVGRAQEPAPPKPPEDVQERLRTIVEEVLVPDGAPPGRPGLSGPPSMLGVHDVPSRRLRDRPAPEAALAARPGSGAAEGAGETLVHVSIGRVEVSAPAAPPQSASARRRPKAPTSLDEYLGRRNGTRR